MNRYVMILTAAAALMAGSTAFAQAPAAAPAGTTGLCKDGSYYTGATKQGACRGHKGVKDWYGAAAAAAATAAPSAAAATAAALPAKPAAKSMSALPAAAAAGGGPGLVWVNTSTKVYHCPSDKYYGRTKQGEYMAEAAATAKGYHAERGKACH